MTARDLSPPGVTITTAAGGAATNTPPPTNGLKYARAITTGAVRLFGGHDVAGFSTYGRVSVVNGHVASGSELGPTVAAADREVQRELDTHQRHGTTPVEYTQWQQLEHAELLKSEHGNYD